MTDIPNDEVRVLGPEPTALPGASSDDPSLPRRRHFLAVFFLSFMWGVFGVDRMYLGKWGTGILKLITFGGLGIWVVVDLALIMGGSMRDKQGREMAQFAEYKKFANRTVLYFALVLGAYLLISGISLIIAVTTVLSGLQDGSFTNMIPGLESLPGGIDQSQLDELGI